MRQRVNAVAEVGKSEQLDSTFGKQQHHEDLEERKRKRADIKKRQARLKWVGGDTASMPIHPVRIFYTGSMSGGAHLTESKP